MPLAVRLVGVYLNETGERAAEYLEWLEEPPLEALSRGSHREDSVVLLLERSVAQVGAAAARILALTGLPAPAPPRRAAIPAR